ncbi:G5 domain-containing protein [Eubacteriaceae bacterium ES3]|nr:G5 domain-containing protein [Eubacteriaceae bacterium ES3]
MNNKRETGGFLKKFPGVKIGIIGLILLLVVGVSSAFTVEKEIRVTYDGDTVMAEGKLLETLEEVLIANDLPVSEEYQYSSSLTSLFKDVAEVEITEKVRGDLFVDGETIEYFAGDETVGELLSNMDVELDENDRVEPSEDTVITEDTGDIKVIRVDVVESSEVREMPMTVTINENSELPVGARVVMQVGQNGKSNVTERIYYENGVEVKREVIKSQIVDAPQEEIIEVGPTTTVTVPSKVQVTKNSDNINVEASDDANGTESSVNESGFYGSMTVSATAYTATGNNTACGLPPQEGRTIATWAGIPFGTKVYIPALGGVYTVEDRGGAVTYGIIDIYMDTEADCIAWGRQTIEIYFLEE